MTIRRSFYVSFILLLLFGACKSVPAIPDGSDVETQPRPEAEGSSVLENQAETAADTEPLADAAETPLVQDEGETSNEIDDLAEADEESQPGLVAADGDLDEGSNTPDLAEANIAARPEALLEDGGQGNGGVSVLLPEPELALPAVQTPVPVPEPVPSAAEKAAVPVPPAPVVPVPPKTPPIAQPDIKPAEEIPPGFARIPAPERPVSPPTPETLELTPVTPLPGSSGEASPADEAIVFSRVVRATVGQLIEIPFRGTGWIYLGELGSRRGIVYDSRRLDPEGQSFVFRSEAAGTYALKFYKQDFIRDFILNDYVQVLIGEAPEISGAGWFNPPVDRGRVIAEPRWPGTGNSVSESSTGSVPAKPADSPAASSGAVLTPVVPAAPPRQTVTDEGITPVSPPSVSSPSKTEPAQTVPPSQSSISPSPSPSSSALPEEYLQKAREEFEAGRVAGALSVLDSFRERFPSGSDEAWWLYGQFYEANSPSRDIRLSLDYYRALIREYPQSNRYNDARSRIAYLERFYIKIQ